jgi:hypothetical protein
MSFNRITYDKCAYDLKMNRSTLPGDYRLYGSYAENCSQCYSADGPYNAKSDVSLPRDANDLSYKNMADVENQLSWRRKKLDECNDNIEQLDESKLRNKPVCSNKLVSEDTRFTNPIDNYRGMSLTSYMLNPHLPINPQCVVQNIDDKYGLNSRLYIKDNCAYNEPIPINQDSIYPQPKKKKQQTSEPITIYAEKDGENYKLPSMCVVNNKISNSCVINKTI